MNFKTISIAVVATALACGTSFAATTTYKAKLDSASEVPPNASKGTGSVEATYDSASKKLTWKGMYSGLTGPETVAHFHGPRQSAPTPRRS